MIRCSFASDWLREWRFLDQSQNEAMKNRSNFGSLLSLNKKCFNHANKHISDLPGQVSKQIIFQKVLASFCSILATAISPRILPE